MKKRTCENIILILFGCKRRKYGQNNKPGRWSYGNYGNEVEIRHERESVVGDRHGEVPVSRDVFFENESEITDEDKKISAQAL